MPGHDDTSDHRFEADSAMEVWPMYSIMDATRSTWRGRVSFSRGDKNSMVVLFNAQEGGNATECTASDTALF